LTVFSVLAVAAAGVALASCASPPARGTLDGAFQEMGGGGAAGTTPRALPGDITIRGTNGNTGVITVGGNGRFSVNPPVGTYTVSGRSPQYAGGNADCEAAGTVTVRKGVTSHVEVDCHE
jgi:hypothetical protein